MEFFQHLFYLIGDYLLRVEEYLSLREQVYVPFNSTFLALIPKVDGP